MRVWLENGEVLGSERLWRLGRRLRGFDSGGGCVCNDGGYGMVVAGVVMVIMMVGLVLWWKKRQV